MPKCNFDITNDLDSSIQEVANRGLTRSQVVQVALAIGLPPIEKATRNGIEAWIANMVQGELSEGKRGSIKKTSAKRRAK